MSAKVIPLRKNNPRLDQIIEAALAKHPPDQCPDVLACLKSELEKIIEKYFIEDAPELSLVLPADLSRDQVDKIRNELHELLNSYNEQMLERSSLIFRDLYQSKLEICRLRHRQTSPGG